LAQILPALLGPGSGAQQTFGQLLWQVYQEVPAYRSLWRAAGVEPGCLHLPAEFERLPIVGRADLQAFPVDKRCRGRINGGMRLARSRESTGPPIEVPLNPASRRRRQRRFFRALLHCGYRPGQRLLLLSRRATAGPARFFNWHYAQLTLDESALATAYLEHRPAVLYGPLSRLLGLADALVAHRDWPRPRVVVSTGEDLKQSARERLSVAFGVEPADFYGLTETGLLAWRKAGQPHYRLAENEFLFEFLPVAEDFSLERLVVTDLGHAAMPLVRFDTGDLVRRNRAAVEPRVLAVSGRCAP
jgi:phenylacetate-coenzyme A ligase PaaK-like adenylate-forming protein